MLDRGDSLYKIPGLVNYIQVAGHWLLDYRFLPSKESLFDRKSDNGTFEKIRLLQEPNIPKPFRHELESIAQISDSLSRPPREKTYYWLPSEYLTFFSRFLTVSGITNIPYRAQNAAISNEILTTVSTLFVFGLTFAK
ncbi:hypothetical protein Zmor_011574 [Zophobas morio]|uniref:Uncharacterized protein n=1 Tax=Zophobas morio TaxID=2755281 RepID=A0AA38IMC5_9CUCU|nr:hypothetical protein Zmor_011574 [Zophobas morio]